MRQQLMTDVKMKEKDTLYQCFLSMYNTTHQLPSTYHRQIRNEMFQIVTQKEGQYVFEKDVITIFTLNTFVTSEKLTMFSHSYIFFLIQQPSNHLTQKFPQLFVTETTQDSDSKRFNSSFISI